MFFRREEFRPCYASLGVLRSHFDSTPFAAFTATCSPLIKHKILDILHLREEEVKTIAVLPDRPNIFLRFVEKHASDMEDALDWYLQELKDKKGECRKAVIYCRNLRTTGRGYGMLMYQLHKKYHLTKAEVSTLISEYHAELFDAERQRITEEFRKNDSSIRCLLSTVAFGMGIDIPDIKFVIHWGESQTVVQYWQEVGRCGRDQSASVAELCHIGQQLYRCDESVKDLIKQVKNGNCIRKAVLDKLKLPEMKERDISEDICVLQCCSSCSIKCCCEKCKSKDDK